MTHCTPRSLRRAGAGIRAVALAVALVAGSWSQGRGETPPGWPYSVEAAPVRGEHAAIATDAPLATSVGIEVLRAGGNAIDAAVATAFALAVVHPQAGNLGGGGFMVLRTAGGEALALDFRETAPAASTRDMYLDADGNPTDRSLAGAGASGVPGSVHGLWEAHRRFGKSAWSDLVAPAVVLADSGYLVDAAWHAAVAQNEQRLAGHPATRAHFLPGGEVPPVGTRVRNPDLAAVLRRIAEDGPAGFYEGETAGLIVAEMSRGGGLITVDDLRVYRPRWRDPIRFQYRGHLVLSMPPPSSGGIALAMITAILEAYDLGALGWRTPENIHLGVEAMRRAFAVRNHALGDPDFVPIATHRILSPGRVEALRSSIDPARATRSETISAVAIADEGSHTTHLSVVDAGGNAVALTTTLNDEFGSCVTVTGGGFLLNNEMDDFAAKPGAPNLYGLVQGEANAIAPGKRMLSSMSPTIVVDPSNEVRLVTGGRGGPTIITSVFQVISAVLDHGRTVAAAVNAPRYHHQHFPDRIRFEPGGFDAATVKALENMGHQTYVADPQKDAIGKVPSIERRAGAWWAAADPRTEGSAAGI